MKQAFLNSDRFKKTWRVITLIIPLLLIICSSSYGQCDSTGNYLKSYGGSGLDRGHSITPTRDGGFAVVGITNSFGAGALDWLLTKFDSEGNIEWSKTYGGSNDEEGRSVRIKQCYDNGYIIAGLSTTVDGSDWDALLIKTDQTGNIEWSKNTVGTEIDRFRGVVQTSDSGFVCAGSFNSNSFDNSDAVVFRLDKNGNQLWSKHFGGMGLDHASDVDIFPNGNILVTLHGLQSYSTNYCGGLLILDDNGNILNRHKYDPGVRSGFISSSILSDSSILSVGIYNLGSTPYEMIVKTASNGNVLWAKRFGTTGTNVAGSSIEDLDGHYLVAGFTSGFSTSGKNLTLLKLSPSGNLIFAKGFDIYGSQNGTDNWAESITLTENSKFLTTGYLVDGGNEDILLGKFDFCMSSSCASFEINSSLVDVNLNRTSLNIGFANYQNLISNSLSSASVDVNLFDQDTICYVTPPLINDSVICNSSNWEFQNYEICEGQAILLPSLSSESIFQYQNINGEVIPALFNNSSPGDTVHEIIVTSLHSEDSCVLKDTFTINVLPLRTMDLILLDSSDQITLTGCCETGYNWFPTNLFANNNQDTISFDFDSTVTVRLTSNALDSNCVRSTDRTFVKIPLLPEPEEIRIPNIITPNGDLVNDLFVLQGLTTVQLRIHDRWGKLVYKSENYLNDWNGEKKSDGTYYYTISSDQGEFKGWIQLIR